MKRLRLPVLQANRILRAVGRGDGPGKTLDGRWRSVTLPATRLTREEVAAGRELTIPEGETFPRTRGECEGAERPCPWVRCRFHLFLDVDPRTGSIKLNYPGREVDEIAQTCALDVADRGGVILEDVGGILNLTRERIRQVEVAGLLKLKMGGEIDDDGEPSSPGETRRRLQRAHHGHGRNDDGN